MNGHQLFNIEKINEVTNPIEYLQGNLSNLEFIYKSFIENKDIVDQTIYDRDFSLNIQSISEKLNKINEIVIKISNENINKFLIFQDLLIKKYINAVNAFAQTYKRIILTINVKNCINQFGSRIVEFNFVLNIEFTNLNINLSIFATIFKALIR